MGLIDAIRRFFATDSGVGASGPRLAELVRQESALLGQALAGAPYRLHDDDEVDFCRVVTDRFTLTFGWDWRDQWLTAAVRLNHPLELPIEFDFDVEHQTRAWLEAVGIVTAKPRADFRSGPLVRDELEILREAIAQVLSDDRKVREAIFYIDGGMRGYTDRVLVPEELPPDPVIVWTEEKLRRLGRPVSMPRAGEGR